jgi:hypothetical protein
MAPELLCCTLFVLEGSDCVTTCGLSSSEESVVESSMNGVLLIWAAFYKKNKKAIKNVLYILKTIINCS